MSLSDQAFRMLRMFLRRSWNIGPAVQFSEPRNAIQVMCSQHDFDGMRSGTSGVHGAGIGNRSTAGYSHVRFLAQAAQAGVFCVELMTEISHHQGHDADRIHLRLHGSSPARHSQSTSPCNNVRVILCCMICNAAKSASVPTDSLVLCSI